MNFKRIDLAEISRCYTVTAATIDKNSAFIFSSDGKEAQGIAFHGDNFSEKEIIWEGAGGCMSIREISNKENELLVLLEFYLGTSPSFSKIVWFKKQNNLWYSKDLYHIPFMHRMDLLEVQDKNYVVCATISHFKFEKEDWNLPGAIYAFELPSNFEDNFDINPILIHEGLYKNHGYFKDDENAYFSGDEGVFKLLTPNGDISTWTVEQIYNQPTSDIILIDINNDGTKELVVIDEFHGNQLRILELNLNNNQYETAYTYTDGAEVIHGLSSLVIGGKNTLVVSVRKGTAELFIVQYSNYKYKKTLIDAGFGPINITTSIINNVPVIATANHTSNLASLYILN